jgi:hypothetical protein
MADRERSHKLSFLCPSLSGMKVCFVYLVLLFIHFVVAGGLRGTGEDNEPLPVIYYMGIIDILQPYNLSKKVESRVKIYAPFYRIPKVSETARASFLLSSPSRPPKQEQLSAVGPHLYARRFQDFLIARVGPGKIVISIFSTSHVSLTVGPHTDSFVRRGAQRGVAEQAASVPPTSGGAGRARIGSIGARGDRLRQRRTALGACQYD